MSRRSACVCVPCARWRRPQRPAATKRVRPVGRSAVCTDSSVRILQAVAQADGPHPDRTNPDERAYADRRYVGSFTKTLPHDRSTGELLDPAPYRTLLEALATGSERDFARIVRATGATMKLADPQGAFRTVPLGIQRCAIDLGRAPTIASERGGIDMLLGYAAVILRDVPFVRWANADRVEDVADPDVRFVLRALNRPEVLRAYPGPLSPITGRVEPRYLLRAGTGEPSFLDGPYVSQFLMANVPGGATTLDQGRCRLPHGRLHGPRGPGRVEFGVAKAEMIRIQDGIPATTSPHAFFETERRPIRNGRDLGEIVHNDPAFNIVYNAVLILQGLGAPPNPGLRLPLANEAPFMTTGGIADAQGSVAGVALVALAHAWWHKWLFSRRLRPEAMSLLVQNVKDGSQPDNPYRLYGALLDSPLVQRIHEMADTVYGVKDSWLASVGYPEGAPPHPAWPAGHPTIAAACVTVAKAMFDCRARWLDLPGVVAANASILPRDSDTGEPIRYAQTGEAGYVAYSLPDGERATVDGELNKLAGNVGIGRQWAGVHYQTDTDAGLRLGERLALHFLRDLVGQYNRRSGLFLTFRLTTMDGVEHVVVPSVLPLRPLPCPRSSRSSAPKRHPDESQRTSTKHLDDDL